MVRFRLKSLRSDPSGWVGGGVMASFGAIAAYRWLGSGNLYFALLCLRDLAAAYFLISRKPVSTQENGRLRDSFLAYISSAIPFVYQSSNFALDSSAVLTVDVFAIVGFAISTIALFELGRSFGVSPKRRSHVQSGIYRLVSHPMYIGYALAEFGQIAVNPINGVIFCGSIALYWIRAKTESRVLRLEQGGVYAVDG